MNNKKTSELISRIRNEYALALGATKWISEGGEILNYIGQKVLLVRYSKENPEGEWKTTTETVDLIGISGFDELTGSYQGAWKCEDGKTESSRITPEGFSFNLPERDLWMTRILPLSLHLRITEATLTYDRYRRLWESRDSLEIPKIREISIGKQKETVGYRRNISLLINTTGGLEVGMAAVRIKSFSSPQSSGKFWTLGLRDWNDCFWLLKIPKDSETDAFKVTIDGEYVGEAKIIDLEG